MCSRFGVAVLLLSLTFACRNSADSELPAELKPKRAVVDTAAVKVPALFAHIPADTPYVFAALEAVPLDYYAKFKQALAPLVSRAIADSPEWQELRGDPVGSAILEELAGKLDAKGIESLGLSAQPRFAIYGLGFAPIVVRIEIKDGKTLRAALERVVRKGGGELPPPETKGGVSFWRRDTGATTAIAGIFDRELVIAISPTRLVDENLGLILGTEKPKASMADGKALLDVMKKHGFGPYGVGYVDTRTLAARLFEQGEKRGAPVPKTCAPEVERITTKIPRLVFGSTEVTAKRISTAFVVELEAGLLAELAAVKTEMPGLGTALAEQPLFAIGGGVDLPKGAALAAKAFASMGQIAERCGAEGNANASKLTVLADKLAKPMPELIAKITGGVAVLHEFSISARDTLEKLDSFVMVTSSSAKQIFELAKREVPGIEESGIEANGKLKKIDLKLKDPKFPLDSYAGVGDRAIVWANGAKGRAIAEKVLGSTARGKAPLFVATLDYGRLFQLASQIPNMPTGDQAELVKILGGMLGRGTLSVDVTDAGLGFWSSIEFK